MNFKSMTAVGLVLTLGACVSAPQPNAALETARAQVAAAEGDPNVARYAPLDLEAAKKDLALAESAAEHHREADISQPAYMAAQTARLAQARAAAKADDARVAQGQQERDRIQLAAQQRQVNAAVEQRNEASQQAAQAAQQAAQANQQAASLQAELEQMKAKQTNRGIVLTLGDVLFDTGRAELNPGAGIKMNQLAQFLTEHPDRRVEIDGFTDSVGSDAYNEELSQRRANSVKAALVSRGIDPTRINTQGYGKAYPVASNSDSGGRQLNRRVEVVIGGNDNAPIVPRG
jgi:outer membrane protein OmpA-like peptidoglycan-associated protein